LNDYLPRISGKRDLLNNLSIDFKQCPTLELVIFYVDIDFVNLLPNCSRKNATIHKLAFNPQLDITQFGVDHIWSLTIWEQNYGVFKFINENVKGLKELWVNEFSYLNNLVCMEALLELHINDYDSSVLKIAGLKKLETLEVYGFTQLDNLVGMDALLELSVTSVEGSELKEYDLSNITKRFKNLQKCDINVTCDADLIQPEKYAQIIQDAFQNSAIRVKLFLDRYLDGEGFKAEEYAQILQDAFQDSATLKFFVAESLEKSKQRFGEFEFEYFGGSDVVNKL
jgi:hypothetical protein